MQHVEATICYVNRAALRRRLKILMVHPYSGAETSGRLAGMRGQILSPKSVFLAVNLIVVSAGMATAHHSTAAYDRDRPQTMQGTVKTVNWTNPHITFVVEKDGGNDGPASTWVFETYSPGILTHAGWTKSSLRPGDHAVFLYAPLRDGNSGGFLQKVTLPSGQELIVTPTPGEQ